MEGLVLFAKSKGLAFRLVISAKKKNILFANAQNVKGKTNIYSSTSLHCTQAQAVKGSIKKAANAYQPI